MRIVNPYPEFPFRFLSLDNYLGNLRMPIGMVILRAAGCIEEECTPWFSPRSWAR